MMNEVPVILGTRRFSVQQYHYKGCSPAQELILLTAESGGRTGSMCEGQKNGLALLFLR